MTVLLLFSLVALGVGLFLANRSVLRAFFDAWAGVSTVDEYVTARCGEVPEWDPICNLEHAQVSLELQGVELAEYEARLGRVEDDLTLHESPLSHTLKLAGCYLAEVLGATLLFKSLGYSGIERIVPAVLFASFLIWITGETKRQGGAA